ncbi:MAG: FixH family protein [Cellvibrionaceae bacterium]
MSSNINNVSSNNPLAEPIPKPWYREFWAWFILSPLIVVVIVSSITVTLAVRHADDRVIDNYYKEGRMINIRQDEDLLAQTLSVKASINFDQTLQELTLQLSVQGELPDSLLLELGHPAQVDLDQAIVLKRVANDQYHAELPNKFFDNRWYLRLAPVFSDSEKTPWRVRGEINFAQTSTVIMQPDI